MNEKKKKGSKIISLINDSIIFIVFFSQVSLNYLTLWKGFFCLLGRDIGCLKSFRLGSLCEKLYSINLCEFMDAEYLFIEIVVEIINSYHRYFDLSKVKKHYKFKRKINSIYVFGIRSTHSINYSLDSVIIILLPFPPIVIDKNSMKSHDI